MMAQPKRCSVLLAGLLATLGAGRAQAQLPVVELVTVASDGTQADGWSLYSSISQGGRFVAFLSRATSLAPGTEAGQFEIYLRDRELGTTQLVSRGFDGSPGNGESGAPILSADGSTLVFSSNASNLVPGDTNGFGDTFLYDVATAAIERVSVATDGSQGDGFAGPIGLSADGSRVVFDSTATNLSLGDTNGLADTFVRFRNAGITRRVSWTTGFEELNSYSSGRSISPNGRYVVFNTLATNMGSGDTTDDLDGYVIDLQERVVLQVTVDESGSQVNFDAGAFDVTDQLEVTFATESTAFSSQALTFNDHWYVHNFESGTNELVSVSSTGAEPFVHGVFLGGQFGAGGRYVIFGSRSEVFEPQGGNGEMRLYVRDRLRQVTENVTATSAGGFLSEDATLYSISPDGRFLSYQTADTGLVPNDLNQEQDIFLLDRRRGSLELDVELLGGGAQGQLSLTAGTPSGPVQVFYSLGAQGLQGSAFGLLTLGPLSSSFTTVLGPGGNRTLVLGVPAGVQGEDIWLQALDLTTTLLAPPTRVTIP